jgi:hypothetical protein
MSQAPDWKTFYKFEANVLAGWNTILQNAGISPDQLFQEFMATSSTTPRMELNVVGMKPTGHKGEYKPGFFTWDAWHGQLITKTITRRNVNGEFHDDLLATARVEALYFNDRFQEDVLPYYIMVTIEDAGSIRVVDPERDEDITELTHAFRIGVRPGAFPAVA